MYLIIERNDKKIQHYKGIKNYYFNCYIALYNLIISD